MKRHLISLITFSISLIVYSQNDSIPNKDFQFSFIYPIGTEGHSSLENSYDISLNLLIGQTGATENFEAGGFLNINKYYTNGAQLSGFANITGTKNSGNYTSSGFQGAGFINVNNTNVEGGQVAGFINTANGSLNGAQIAGFINYHTTSINGVQVAGFGNVASKGKSKVQVAGFVNHNSNTDGVQIAGFVNNTNKTDKGVQVAGFVNTAPKGTSSAQVAGFINVADKVDGLQLAGFINVCDSIDGVPIAFMSIVKKNGFRAFEISTSDFSMAQASFKMGVSHFYNIYTFSKLPDYNTRWAIGAGFGYTEELKNSWNINLEATVHQELWIDDKRVNEAFYFDRTNLVNQIKFGIGIPIGSFATFNIAPTFNVGIARNKSNSLGNQIQPHWNSTLSSHTVGNKTISTWFGFSSGIQF